MANITANTKLARDAHALIYQLIEMADKQRVTDMFTEEPMSLGMGTFYKLLYLRETAKAGVKFRKSTVEKAIRKLNIIKIKLENGLGPVSAQTDGNMQVQDPKHYELTWQKVPVDTTSQLELPYPMVEKQSPDPDDARTSYSEATTAPQEELTPTARRPSMATLLCKIRRLQDMQTLAIEELCDRVGLDDPHG